MLPCFQVDTAASYLGTPQHIGQLVSAADIPCGSSVTLIGQKSGPVVFSCSPMQEQKPVRIA